MPRLIFKCSYLSPNTSRDRGGYATYVATRDGVELIPQAKRELPATEKQRTLISRILKDFPSAKESFEYEDYLENPTMGNASEFICRALEDNLLEAGGREGYVPYISQRPGAVHVGSHGLFGAGDAPLVLSRVAEEIWTHPGNIWTPIISLRREDAARLGYDNAENWRALLRAHMDTFARWLKIPLGDLVWYAAFHDESHHPHVHMLCYSRDPSKGYLTRDGIQNMRSELVRDIFRCDLQEIYIQQTLHRTETRTAAGDALRKVIAEMKNGVLDNKEVMNLMEELVDRLRHHSGKMVYGYLRPPVKVLVGRIVDELAKDPRVAAAYARWQEERQAILQSYKDIPEPAVPLSRNKAFKQIRNLVVREAAQLLKGDFVIEQPEVAHGSRLAPSDDSSLDGLPEIVLPPEAEAALAQHAAGIPFVAWTDRYKLALTFLYGTKTIEPSVDDAYELLLLESEAGNALAMHDIGRILEKGLGREIDLDAAHIWYGKALEGFLQVEDTEPHRYVEYRIGKMYNAGLGTVLNHAEAARWFERSAAEDYKYAQYQLGKLLLEGSEVPMDIPAAVHWLTASASQGNVFAAYRLGRHLLSGGQGERDIRAGLHWMTAAANAGNQYAQYTLGKFYLFGDTHLRDEEAAVHWLTLSAEQGNIYAAFLLEHRDQWHRGAVLLAGTRLLSGIGRIFSAVQLPSSPGSGHRFSLDQKRRRELMQKKGGKGIREQEMAPL